MRRREKHLPVDEGLSSLVLRRTGHSQCYEWPVDAIEAWKRNTEDFFAGDERVTIFWIDGGIKVKVRGSKER